MNQQEKKGNISPQNNKILIQNKLQTLDNNSNNNNNIKQEQHSINQFSNEKDKSKQLQNNSNKMINQLEGFHPSKFQFDDVSSISHDYMSQNFMTNQISPDKQQLQLRGGIKQNEQLLQQNMNVVSSPKLKTLELKESTQIKDQNNIGLNKETKTVFSVIAQTATIENKLKKSLEFIQKEKMSLQENLIQANDQQTTYKLEIFNLKKQLQKSEQQIKTQKTIIQQLNDTIKEKDDTQKKCNMYIKQLENQILKGSNSKNTIEIHKRNEEKLEQYKQKNEELIKELTQFRNQEIMNSKEIEYLKTSLEQHQSQSQQMEDKSIKQDMLEEVIELRQELKKMKSDKEKFMLELEDCEAINQSLCKVNETLQQQVQNLQVELSSCQSMLDKLSQDNSILIHDKSSINQRCDDLYQENQKIKRIIETSSTSKEDDLARIKELNKYIDELNEQFQNRQEQWLLEQQNYENKMLSYANYQQQKEDQINQLRNLIDRMQAEFSEKYSEVSSKYVKMQKINTKLFEMLDMCEGLLDENFVTALEETLSSVQQKKQIKKDITQIVESCAKNLTQVNNHNNNNNNNNHKINNNNIQDQSK